MFSTFDYSLLPGASEEAIQKLESVLGADLPLLLRCSFLLHNGQYEKPSPVFFERLFSVEEATELLKIDRLTYDYQELNGLLICPVSAGIGVDVFTGQVYRNVRPYGYPILVHSTWIQYLTVN